MHIPISLLRLNPYSSSLKLKMSVILKPHYSKQNYNYANSSLRIYLSSITPTQHTYFSSFSHPKTLYVDPSPR